MTWEATAARLGDKIASAEDLDAKLSRLLYAARGLWNDFMRLAIAKDRLRGQEGTERHADLVRMMQGRDAELYAIESQIKATDKALVALADADPVITHSSHRRLRRHRYGR